jgi:hypothetical protein
LAAVTGSGNIRGAALFSDGALEAEGAVRLASTLGVTGISSLTAVTGSGNIRGAALFSDGILEAEGAVRFASSLSVNDSGFVIDGASSVTSAGSANLVGALSGSNYLANATLTTQQGLGALYLASSLIVTASTPGTQPIVVGASAAKAHINDIPHIQIMGTDSGGLLQEFKFQVSGGILQVNQV